MPELPEVEVVRKGLEKLLGQAVTPLKIEKFEFHRRDLRDPIPIKKLQSLVGAQLLGIERRAKYLIFRTDKGDILSHLGMTGSWRPQQAGEPVGTHDHLRICFSQGQVWTYRDPRRFGIFDYLDVATLKKRLGSLGPEPLGPEFTGLALWQRLHGKKTSVKAAIMDQKVVVGVGNIYASEALFLAGIHPKTRAHKLGKLRAENLAEKIKILLRAAIAAGGSTISDFTSVESTSGYFQQGHQVYDRAGEPCPVCAAPIRSAVMAGRSTYWCPTCQR